VYRRAAEETVHALDKLAECERQAQLRQFIARVTLIGSQLEIRLHCEALSGYLRGIFPGALLKDWIEDPITLEEPIEIKERGNEILILRPKQPIRSASPDAGLITAIARAQHWRELLTAGEVTSLEDIAETEGLSRRYVGYIIHLASLAPDIVEEILSGRRRRRGDPLREKAARLVEERSPQTSAHRLARATQALRLRAALGPKRPPRAPS
ncbi:MAG: hypothetical protein P8X75_06490, partial [Limibacillus sp.]